MTGYMEKSAELLSRLGYVVAEGDGAPWSLLAMSKTHCRAVVVGSERPNVSVLDAMRSEDRLPINCEREYWGWYSGQPLPAVVTL